MAKTKTKFGDGLLEGLREAVAWKRGKIALEVRNVDPMPAERVKAIRKAVSKSLREFEEKFHVPARTIEGWEQGRRKPDLAARILLTVIDKEPETVAKALEAA